VLVYVQEKQNSGRIGPVSVLGYTEYLSPAVGTLTVFPFGRGLLVFV